MASNERIARVRRGAAGLADRVAATTDRVAFPHLVAATFGAVFLTVLLGIATKATGSGLACNARWPLCNGGLLNLFPADLPSFFEWFHRLWAGLTGFVMLGAAVAAWRRDVPRRVRQAVTLGVVLLPLQVLLGRETVVTFTVPVLMAHFWTAFTIFASFAVATLLTWRTALTPRRLRAAGVAGGLLVPLQVLLHPPFVVRFTPPVHTFQYAVVLSTFTLAVAVALGGRRHLERPAARAVVALPVLHAGVLFAGRQLYAPSGALLGAYLLAALGLAVGLLVAGVAVHRRSTATAAE